MKLVIWSVLILAAIFAPGAVVFGAGLLLGLAFAVRGIEAGTAAGRR